MTMPSLTAESLEQALETLPHDSLTGLRKAALTRFVERGFPTTRDEDWKYTDLAPVAEISRRWLERGAPRSPAAEWRRQLEDAKQLVDADWIVIANGRVVETPDLAGPGKSITLQRIGETAVDAIPDTSLADLNAALLADGVHLRIHENAVIDRPIGLLIADGSDDAPVVCQAHLSIDAGRSSRVAVFEYHVSAGEADHYANVVTRMALAADAQLDYVRLQHRDRNHSQTTLTDVQLSDRSSLHYSGFDIGGELVRNDVTVQLSGRDASISIDGLFIADTGQHIDNHVRVDHHVGPATSAQDFRGILGAGCRCVWNGKAVVHTGADGTDARQTSHNLLLTEGSEVDAKPELEIYADDVKCSHGATVGQLDEDALFYLRTRGLDRKEAARALTRAFGATIVGRTPIASLAESLAAIVEARLGEVTGAVDA